LAPSGNVTDGAEPRPEELFAKGWTVRQRRKKKTHHKEHKNPPMENLSTFG